MLPLRQATTLGVLAPPTGTVTTPTGTVTPPRVLVPPPTSGTTNGRRTSGTVTPPPSLIPVGRPFQERVITPPATLLPPTGPTTITPPAQYLPPPTSPEPPVTEIVPPSVAPQVAPEAAMTTTAFAPSAPGQAYTSSPIQEAGTVGTVGVPMLVVAGVVAFLLFGKRSRKAAA